MRIEDTVDPKVFGACLLGIALGMFYLYLGYSTFSDEEFDVGAYFFSIVLYLPGLWYFISGKADRYERRFDERVTLIAFFATGMEFLGLLVQIVFHVGWLKVLHWLPDLSIDLLFAVGSFRRAFLWSKLLFAKAG